MAIFALVPGMWHGGWCWKKVTPLLRAAGHEVYGITLTGLGERSHLRYPDIDLNTHVQDIINVLVYEDLQNVVLVGHSYGGTIISQVADRIPEQIGQLINIDGPIPMDGQNFIELMPDLWTDFRARALASGDEWWAPIIPEWTFGANGADLDWMRSKLTAHPLKTWNTRFSLTNSAGLSIPRVFVHCIEGVSSEEIVKTEKDCEGMDWHYRNLLSDHDAMITVPQELTQLLLEYV